MNYRLQIKIGIGSLFVLASLALVTYYYYLSISHLVEAHNRAKTSLKVIQTLENIHLLIKDSEASHRDYLASGNEKLLEPYYHQVFRLEEDIKIIAKKIKADSLERDQVQLFEQILPLVNKRLALNRQMIHLKINHLNNVLLDSIDSEYRHGTLKRISELIHQMELRQEAYLEIMNADETQTTKYLIKLVPIIAGIIAILLLGGAVLLILDVSERQRLQLHLARTNEELQTTIEALDKSNKELLQLNSSLESFSAAVSHDLKSPANQQMALVDLLMHKEGAKISNEGKLFLEKIKQSASKMKTLISDLLQFSRLGKKELHKSQVNLETMIQQILESQKIMYSKTYEIKLATLPEINADEALIRQVWENLLSNAFKYSSKTDKPCIQIDVDTQKNQYVFAVKDNGDGFDMSKAERMFQVFQRMHRADEFEGTGVGLSIVHKIIEKHGGRIWAVAAPKQGACFYFTLPK